MRIFLAAVAILTAVAGCQAGASGKDGTQLRFRPVLRAWPAGPAVGPPGRRQSTNPGTQEAAARALSCAPEQPDDLDGRDDPVLPLVSCARTGRTRYVLGPGFLSGAEVGSAEARLDPATGETVLVLSFTDAGADTWAEWTRRNVGREFAVVLKSRVLAAQRSNAVVTDGAVQVGLAASLPEAQRLARDIDGA
ncbi:SecDF P1 head subdomain-containing protein [Amycolatopsis plumensis]|uniref:Precorrin-3B C(17)-methyltransferase n=1 Tax=Amycolatopsis plumensis TaxID=236508 RepID=A0ABV5U0U4_9PSEU